MKKLSLQKERDYLAGLNREASWYSDHKRIFEVKNLIGRTLTTLEDTFNLFEKDGSVRGPGTVLSNMKSVDHWVKSIMEKIKG
jgi:hypothetical protein